MNFKRGPKYRVGDRYYMKSAYKSLVQNEEVEIVSVNKVGRYTWLDVRNINGDVTSRVSYKKLRKRPR